MNKIPPLLAQLPPLKKGGQGGFRNCIAGQGLFTFLPPYLFYLPYRLAERHQLLYSRRSTSWVGMG